MSTATQHEDAGQAVRSVQTERATRSTSSGQDLAYGCAETDFRWGEVCRSCGQRTPRKPPQSYGMLDPETGELLTRKQSTIERCRKPTDSGPCQKLAEHLGGCQPTTAASIKRVTFEHDEVSVEW